MEQTTTTPKAERFARLARGAEHIVKDATAAQDRLGWADPTDHQEVTFAAVDLAKVAASLARVVRELARELSADE